MPVIAAILFEFTLRELQLRAGRADRRLAALRWLHPAERVRVQLRLAADDHISAEAATRRVRIDLAARRLYQLRRALLAQGRAARPEGMAARHVRLAEHRAHAALIRAGFADQAIAVQVLRQVQVFTRTRDLARLDYTTAEAAQAAIAALITSGPPAEPPGPLVMPPGPAMPGADQDGISRNPASGINGTAAGQVLRAGPGPGVAAARAPQAAAAGRDQRSGGRQPGPGPGRPAHRRRHSHRRRCEAERRAAQPESARRPAPPRRSPCRQPRPAVAAGRSRRPGRKRPASGRPVMPVRLPGQAGEREETASARSARYAPACTKPPMHCAHPMTGPPAWAWPRGSPARTSRISCSSTPSGPAPPWSGTTSSGPRPEDRSAKARAVSRSSLFCADRIHGARTKIRTSLNRSGARPTGLPISGTCPRPPGRPPPPPSVRTIRPLLCGRPCAGWPAARGMRSNWSTGLHPTAPCSGPSAASASHPGSAASRPCGHWHTSSATCCCTMIPATRPGRTTTSCAGLRKAEADSVAWITCARHGITPVDGLPYPASWAGTDPRAQPAATLLAAGHRITAAGTRITRHTSRILHGDPAPVLLTRPGRAAQAANPGAGQQDTVTPQPGIPSIQPAASHAPESDGTIRILVDAHAFYTGQLAGSWAPGYLHARGITADAIQHWHIGYAPAGWNALTSHLRRLGHHDDAIQAAGLATCSSRGTLIDRFRDRIMLPVHDAAGMLAGFTGRAHPDAGPPTPKYLNSPETATYKKSHLLFGLYQARPALARGATPVIAEGAFDAIAISIADPGHHAALAPCGTALTCAQAAQLSQAANLPRTGIIVAFDSDTAGRKAAIRAHGILCPLTGKLQSATLDAKDPAEILQRDGPAALRVILREHRQPLSALLIDISIEDWGRRLDDIGGPLLAMRSAASLIASLLPDGTASQIRDITAGRELQTTDDLLRPIDNPEIPQIAGILPGDTSYQIVRAAGKLGFDCTEVLTEVANATTRNTGSAGHQPRAPRNDQRRSPAAPQPSAARLASTSFPRPPLTPQASPELPRRPAAPASRQRLNRLAR